MDKNTYNKIKKFCTKNLIHKYHNLYLDDCVQYVAMEHFLNPKRNFLHILIDFLRVNGISGSNINKKNEILSRAYLDSQFTLEDNKSFIENEIGCHDSFYEELDYV